MTKIEIDKEFKRIIQRLVELQYSDKLNTEAHEQVIRELNYIDHIDLELKQKKLKEKNHGYQRKEKN